MPVDPNELSQYAGQKVIVTYVPDGENEAKEVEGTAEAANAQAVVLKPKGRQNVELIAAGQIEEISFAPEKAKELKTQELAVVKYGAARKHLLDRHAGRLDKVNKLSEEDALTAHADTDHKNLGHNHEKKDKPVEEAAAPTES